jgi:hypothetical protein
MAGVVRIICAGLLVLLATISAVAIVRAYPIQPVGVCYAIDDGHVETTYVNVPNSGAYPIASEGSIEQIDGGFIARHAVRFEYRVRRVWLPQVTR